MEDGRSQNEWEGLDLTMARRILHHAGRPDPMQQGDDFSRQLQTLIDSLCNLSVHDGLTGLVNATFFHATLNRELDRGFRTGRACALLLIDVDFFKQVNDNHGHSTGDCVLQSFAAQMKKSLRSIDTAARLGGDEFAIILPECPPDDAVHAGNRIHREISPLEVAVGDSMLLVTASAGLAWADMHPGIKGKELLKLADAEMYRAKQLGRGRLCHPPLKSIEVSAAERSILLGLTSEEDSNAH
jgi:diguanylate cyclase (GGDEF)-like protein